MNANFKHASTANLALVINPGRVFNDEARIAEDEHRAVRLRRDWHTREAIRVYLATRLVRELLHVEAAQQALTPDDAAALLQPYHYLSNVPQADFQWEKVPTIN